MKTKQLVQEAAGAGCLSMAGLVPDGGMALAGAGLFLAFKNKFKDADQAAIDATIKRVVKTARNELKLFHRPLDKAIWEQQLAEDDARFVVIHQLRHAMPKRERIVETAFDIEVLTAETVEALVAGSEGKLDPDNAEAIEIAHAYVKAFLTALEKEQGFLTHLNAELTLETARDVKALREEVRELPGIARDTKALRDEVRKISDKVSAKEGVPVPALRMIALTFDETMEGQFSSDELLQFLHGKALEYRELSNRVGQDRNISPEIGALRAKAKTQLDAGEFDAARALLKQAREAQTKLREEQELEAAQRRAEEVELLTEEAKAAAFALDYGVAGALYLQAVELSQQDDVDAAAMLAFGAANVMDEGAQRMGDNAGLSACISLYELNADLRPKEKNPRNWAATQNNLANVLQTLGERRGDDDMLHRAIQAYEAALTVHTQEAAPVDWAATQNNLAVVLQILGKRRGDEDMLHEAEKAATAALEMARTKGALNLVEMAQLSLEEIETALRRLREA